MPGKNTIDQINALAIGDILTLPDGTVIQCCEDQDNCCADCHFHLRNCHGIDCLLSKTNDGKDVYYPNYNPQVEVSK